MSEPCRPRRGEGYGACGDDVPLVVHRQDPLDILGIRQPDVEAPIPKAFFGLSGVGGAVLVHRVHQGELPGGGGGRLDVIQVGGVLPQQFPDSRELLLLQTAAVEVLVGLERTPGSPGPTAAPRGWP